jgi:HSP20 family protein
VTVNGEVRKEEEDSNALHPRTGRFRYHASLPSDVDGDNVEASMDEGVLTLRVLKAKRGQGHRIKITDGGSGHKRSEGGRSEGKR